MRKITFHELQKNPFTAYKNETFIAKVNFGILFGKLNEKSRINLLDCLWILKYFSPIFIDKNKIFLDHLIGQTDGSYFELKDKYLYLADTKQAKESIQLGLKCILESILL